MASFISSGPLQLQINQVEVRLEGISLGLEVIVEQPQDDITLGHNGTCGNRQLHHPSGRFRSHSTNWGVLTVPVSLRIAVHSSCSAVAVVTTEKGGGKLAAMAWASAIRRYLKQDRRSLPGRQPL